jgi:hypothetical protein
MTTRRVYSGLQLSRTSKTPSLTVGFPPVTLTEGRNPTVREGAVNRKSTANGYS